MKMNNGENKSKRFSAIKYNVVGVIFVVILFFVLRSNQGYGFVFKMLQGNYEYISRFKHASLQDRNLSKMGNSYNLFLYIVANTPSDAVLYLPGADAFKDKSFGMEFEGEPYNKGWATRFLYPRKIVLESEYEKSAYSKDITHVVIVNKVGAEILPYQLDSIPVCAIFPIKLSAPQMNKTE